MPNILLQCVHAIFFNLTIFLITFEVSKPSMIKENKTTN